MSNKPFQVFVLSLVMQLASTSHAQGPAAAPTMSRVQPRMEVCFVLDTTGSMTGLIAGAKRKIWYIANQLVQTRPAPDIRFCLLGFRDRGDNYVTRHFDLNRDLDDIYRHLTAFSAAGGGDTPESVNQALFEAVTSSSWSRDDDVLRTIFLVGDSPPHMDYPQDIKYPRVTRMARERDIIINTIQCGTNPATTPVWQDIARRAHGSYSAIPQSGNVRLITTPMDQDLVALNRKLGETLVPYGSREARKTVRAKQAASEKASDDVISDRLGYNSKTGRIVQGGGDLIDDLDAGHVRLEDIPVNDLPGPLRGLSSDERLAWLDQRRQERNELLGVVGKLAIEREAYLARNRKDRKGQDAFDQEVTRMLREQAARKGIYYE